MTTNDTVYRTDVLRVIEEWRARVGKIQQNDMPGFVYQYTPSLVGFIEALDTQPDSLTRVKTALHRLADRVAFDDENTIQVPLDEILLYTPENRANIARMIRREADSL